MEGIQSLAPQTDDLLIAAYRHLLLRGRRDDQSLSRAVNAPLEHIEGAYRRLEDLHVIEPLGDRAADWRVVEPQVAMARHVLPLEAEVARRSAQAEQLRNLFQTLVPVHQAIIGERSQQMFETVADDATLAALLEVEINKCTDEILLLQPNGEDFSLLVDQCLGALGREVAIRGVFPHGARYDQTTEDLVGLLARFGARFRTVDELPVYLMVLDARCCLIRIPSADRNTAADGDQPADEGLPACSDPVAMVVRHPLLVSQFSGIFATSWDRATLFSADDARPAPIVDQLKHSILRLLASGAKDEMVARRLGLSVRTCRRHISDLMRSLDVSSRFQAGVEARELGLVQVTTCKPRYMVSSLAE
jgi:DNA-binding CsgD family transcriptional regulator